MDGRQFDAVTRRMQSVASRRGLIRWSLLPAIAAAFPTLRVGPRDDVAAKKKKIEMCLNGQTLTVAKKKKKQFAKQGATAGACPVSPPPAPPSPPPPTCTGQLLCVGACCDQCCPPLTGQAQDVDVQCAGAEDVCCSATSGGGFCFADEKCCPPTTQDPLGTCADTPDAVCCNSDQGGGWCPSGATCCFENGCGIPGESACCPPAVGGGECPVDFPACCPEEVGFSCCENLEDCCVEGETDCGEGRVCVIDNDVRGGCCVDETLAMRTRSSTSSRFRQNTGRNKKGSS